MRDSGTSFGYNEGQSEIFLAKALKPRRKEALLCLQAGTLEYRQNYLS
jgi:hypothetical protein